MVFGNPSVSHFGHLFNIVIISKCIHLGHLCSIVIISKCVHLGHLCNIVIISSCITVNLLSMHVAVCTWQHGSNRVAAARNPPPPPNKCDSPPFIAGNKFDHHINPSINSKSSAGFANRSSMSCCWGGFNTNILCRDQFDHPSILR